MKQWKLLIAVAMLLAFAAGTVVGLGRGRMNAAAPADADQPFDGPPFGNHGPHGHGGPPEANLSEILSLTPDQRTQVRAIWESLLSDGPHLFEQRRQLQSQYRAKAESLLSPDQKKQYDALQSDYADACAQHDQTMHANFEAAVAKTKALLTPEQREKYDQILARHHGPNDPGDPKNHDHGPDGPHGPDDAGPHGGPHPDDQSPLLGPQDSFNPHHQ